MSASLASGTYGRQPAFGGALRQLFGSLLGSRPHTRNARQTLRVREANEVRALARSVELQSPGFAADLFAAASRHEGLDD